LLVKAVQNQMHMHLSAKKNIHYIGVSLDTPAESPSPKDLAPFELIMQ
jgi:hypothetical protein